MLKKFQLERRVFKNETERAFVLVMLMCGFVFLWLTVSDLAFGSR